VSNIDNSIAYCSTKLITGEKMFRLEAKGKFSLRFQNVACNFQNILQTS
jgi:hypothetical protein